MNSAKIKSGKAINKDAKVNLPVQIGIKYIKKKIGAKIIRTSVSLFESFI